MLTQTINKVVSEQTKLWNFGREKHYSFRRVHPPEAGWEYGDYVPGIITQEGENRKEEIDSKIQVLRWMIAHEIIKPQVLPKRTKVNINWKQVATVAGAVAAVAVLAIAVPAVISTVAAASVVAVADPALICVLPNDDGTGEVWLEVYRWTPKISLSG